MTPFIRFRALAGASVLALATTPAVSQDAAAPIVLDEIVLTATSDVPAQADGYVATYGQIATKSDTALAETQQSISVVTRQQIEDQGARTLGQALNYSAGVLGEPFGADPRFDSPTIRGFDARSAQYVNGLRQLRAVGAPAYETYGLQQIEVLRGPASTLYGAGAPSGIINQVQKRAQDGDFTEIGLAYDDNNSRQLFFDVNRAASDTLAWRITGTGRDIRQQIDGLDNERGYLAGALRWRPDAATTIDVIASHTQDAPISPTGVPFGLTALAGGDTLRDLPTGEAAWDDSDRRVTNFGVEISRDLDNGWTLSQGFRAETFDWTYRGTYVRLSDKNGVFDGGVINGGTQIRRGNNLQIEDTSGINLDTRLAGEVVTGALTHRLLTGLDIRSYDADTTTEFYTGTPLDWRTGATGGGPVGAPFFASASDITQRQIGIYVQDEITAGNWRGALALRQDWTKQTDNSGLNDTLDQSDDALTGRAGLSYVMANGIMPYAAYSTSFDPEIGLDENGDALRPTKAEQWELGVKYQPQDFNGLFTAAIYDLTQENLTRNLGNGVFRQIGEVSSRGLELEATAELPRNWDLRAGYAYNDTEQKGGPNDGNALPNAPRHIASLWLDHDFGGGLRAGGGLRYLGSRQGDDGNTVALGSVNLVDLGATYTRGAIETQLNVTNLTDETYLANCGSFGCFYGEGRTVTAQVTYQW